MYRSKPPVVRDTDLQPACFSVGRNSVRPRNGWGSVVLRRAVVSRIARLVETSEFKRRQAAPALRVSAKAFGVGRRIPIARNID